MLRALSQRLKNRRIPAAALLARAARAIIRAAIKRCLPQTSRRAHALAAGGDWAAAAAIWRNLARGRVWASTVKGAEGKALALTEYGRCCLHLGRLEEAEQALNEAVALQSGSSPPDAEGSSPALRLLGYVAIDKQDWPDAELRWRDLSRQLHEPEEKSEALRNMSLAMSRQERPGEAKAALEQAYAIYPSVMALRMLGQLAAERRDWRQAMDYWREALDRAGDAEEKAAVLLALTQGHRGLGELEKSLALAERLADFCREQGLSRDSRESGNPENSGRMTNNHQPTEWEKRRHVAVTIQARNLQLLERYAEAVDLVESFGADLMPPPSSHFRKHYIDTFMRPEARGDGAKLAASCESGFLSRGATAVDHRLVEILIHCNRFQTARAAYARCFDEVAARYDFRQLLRLAGGLFHGEERTFWYGKILERATAMRDAAAEDLRQRRLEQARLAALYGLRDDAGFGEAARSFHDRFPTPAEEHLAVYERMRESSPERGGNGAARSRAPEQDAGRGKVFGIGLTRTATTSLNDALRALGYNAIHFTNPYSRELIEDRDLHLFDGFTDTPIAWRFEALYERYPQAAFIYTTRPLAQWTAGLLRHLHWYHDAPSFADFRRQLDEAEEYPHGEALRQIYQNLYGPYATPKAAYQAHERRVHEFFAANSEARFLELNIFAADGWDKLAGFLGRAAPETAFPHQNLAAVKSISVEPAPPPAADGVRKALWK